MPRQTIEALLAWKAKVPGSIPYVLLTPKRWRRVKKMWALCQAGKPWRPGGQTGGRVVDEWDNRCVVNNVLRTVRSHVRQAKLQLTAAITIHTLRKSFAQNHADNGTPSSTLKTLMGHASITTTEEHYLQQLDENDLAAARRYENLLSGKTCVKLAFYGVSGPSQNEGGSNSPPQPLAS